MPLVLSALKAPEALVPGDYVTLDGSEWVQVVKVEAIMKLPVVGIHYRDRTGKQGFAVTPEATLLQVAREEFD